MTGTITHIDDDRVYAFGHPFYNLGPDAVPDEEGLRLLGLPEPLPVLEDHAPPSTPWAPWTRTAPRPSRAASAPRPAMIPVEVQARARSRGQERHFSFRIVEDELFSPVLAYVSLLSVLQGNERAFGTSTVRVDARLTLSGGREVRVEDLFTRGPALACRPRPWWPRPSPTC